MARTALYVLALLAALLATVVSPARAALTVTDGLTIVGSVDAGGAEGPTAPRSTAYSPGTIDIVVDPLFGYMPLASFGVTPMALPGDSDDGGWIISGFDIDYMGQNYTNGIWSVNGTLELGTTSMKSTPSPLLGGTEGGCIQTVSA